jgi:glycosyltransferase involved in cell wall biosynthesis
MQKAAHTIFVSRAVREAALRLRLVCESKSSVIPMGVHPSCTPLSNEEADRRAYRLLEGAGRRPLLLHVGSVVPRKRIDVLLQVTAQVSGVLPDTVLVRVGGNLTEEQRRLAIKLGIEGRVVELPYLDRDVLAAVYRRADLVLQPSDAEGFGLPLVEAMACGCPVMASDLPVLREVGGAAALYCPVGDVKRWSEQVIQFLQSSCGGPSEEMQDAMARQAAKFGWVETTRQVVQIYEQLVAQKEWSRYE